jgi:FkbM family methyltransferase
MTQFEDLIYIRHEPMENVPYWYWIKKDTGAYDGPRADWIGSHRDKYTKYCKKFDVVIAAGGNQGMYPRLFSDIFGYVYTFEPDPLNFYVLSRNCQKENIFKIQAALGAEPSGIVLQRLSEENVGMHKVISEGQGAIPLLTLDSFSFPTVDLMQLDVEGYELNILHGARETINKHKPVISCENGNAEILKFLSQFGYEQVDQSVSDTIYKPRD